MSCSVTQKTEHWPIRLHLLQEFDLILDASTGLQLLHHHLGGAYSCTDLTQQNLNAKREDHSVPVTCRMENFKESAVTVNNYNSPTKLTPEPEDRRLASVKWDPHYINTVVQWGFNSNYGVTIKVLVERKAGFTFPNQPCPISFKYSRLWRPISDDFSSCTEREKNIGNIRFILDRTTVNCLGWEDVRKTKTKGFVLQGSKQNKLCLQDKEKCNVVTTHTQKKKTSLTHSREATCSKIQQIFQRKYLHESS